MREVKLPVRRVPLGEVLWRLEAVKSEDTDWKSGRMFSLIYNAGEEIKEVARQAFDMFFMENGLSPFAFPSLKKLETEVIAMAVSLLGGDAETVGSFTCGGTESIFMAVKTARDWARAERPDAKAPEIIKPTTAHPAFNKSAHYLGLKVINVPVGGDFRADVKAMADAVTDNTIMMIGSAMTYPHGMVDPIEELGEIASKRGIWLHVDSCLGGFILPFVKKLGYEVPAFDFSVPGVVSMSADLHKYGFAAKGASTVLYRNSGYRQYQYYAYADFPGGVYATSTLTGARPGGPIAAAWAVMNYLGEEGYLELARTAMETTKKLIVGINGIPKLKVLGAPHATVFAIASDEINVYALSDSLKQHGWLVEKQHLPASLHITVSPIHAGLADEFLSDLAACVKEVERLEAADLSEEAVMYGMMASLPDRSAACDFAVQYLNQLYRLE
ncbi:MAG: aspartate aminotransferase family protein [Candidatus Abyssubacteria bacterium]